MNHLNPLGSGKAAFCRTVRGVESEDGENLTHREVESRQWRKKLSGFRLAATRAHQVFGLEECFVGATVR